MLNFSRIQCLGESLLDATIKFKTNTALIEADRERENGRWTYADLRKGSEHVAARLQENRFQAGDRCAILMSASFCCGPIIRQKNRDRFPKRWPPPPGSFTPCTHCHPAPGAAARLQWEVSPGAHPCAGEERSAAGPLSSPAPATTLGA